MEELQAEFSLTYLLIAHDLSVGRYISDWVVVMYVGKIMELANREILYRRPRHPYTMALLSAVPVPDSEVESRRQLADRLHEIWLPGALASRDPN